MPQLRHIEILPMRLPVPPATAPGEDVIYLQNLHTLKNVYNLSLSEDVYKRIPNVKELWIERDSKDVWASSPVHLHNLTKLESLRCRFYIKNPLQNLKVPNSLKQVHLSRCRLAWSDMELFAILPHLQILQLEDYAVVGVEWNLGVELEFVSLKHLEIGMLTDLNTWTADASNFPVLETLLISYLSSLDEIPPGIGEILTLETLKVYQCSTSANLSAIKILEEQRSNGNNDSQLYLSAYTKDEAQMLRARSQELGITLQNLHISGIQ